MIDRIKIQYLMLRNRVRTNDNTGSKIHGVHQIAKFFLGLNNTLQDLETSTTSDSTPRPLIITCIISRIITSLLTVTPLLSDLNVLIVFKQV